MAILAPRWANFMAIAAPIPRLAPVTEEGIQLIRCLDYGCVE